MSDDFNPDDLHPEDVTLDPDLTSEMTRLRPVLDDEEAAVVAAGAAESDTEPAASEADILMAERDQFRDIALRLQADFDNYRKRVAAQQDAEVQRATGKMAESLLPVLDACEAAFVQHPAEVEPLFNLLLGELRRMGLESMNLDGQPFDPALAEAVLHEPGDGESVVVEVLRSGYTWKGKVLRPAMVKVRGS
ncbi:MAG: GrpE protein [Actinomycetota bacterium]|jgi:molecular chaperone GrpE